jgi:uncharacterized membrane protein
MAWLIDELGLRLAGAVAWAQNPGGTGNWEHWPFGPGVGESFMFTLTRFLFIVAVFAAIVFYLRFLFGPRGIFRDKELEREAEVAKKEALAELDRKLASGEINEIKYEFLKRRL